MQHRMSRKQLRQKYQQAKELMAKEPSLTKAVVSKMVGMNDRSLRRYYHQEFGHPSSHTETDRIKAVEDVPVSKVHGTPPSESIYGNGYLEALGHEILNLINTVQTLREDNKRIKEEFVNFKIETANYIARLR